MQRSEQTTWDRVRETFQQVWGYEDFRPPQGEIVRTLLTGQDALIVLPTGAGKSICFQLPALMRGGLTLVVSPLVALMENQVQELRQRNLPAASLHGELSPYQRRQTLAAIDKQRLRLLYLSPETLLSPAVWERLCQAHIRINGLILDEAHCLVQWGETFRPAYRRLGAVRPALLQHKPPGTQIAIAAFTATADPQAQQEIERTLQLHQPSLFRFSPYRPNLFLSVQMSWTPRGRRQRLRQFIKARAGQSGLVYVRTRRDSDRLAEWLRQAGHKTTAYHAGLSPDQRRAVEAAWINNTLEFVVCTSAFGMGINKPDVRWVIHFHAPALLSEYVQEVGRGGRDGKPAEALTLVSEPTGWLDPEDRQRSQFFLDQMQSQRRTAQQLAKSLPPHGEIRAVEQQFKDGAIALSLLHSQGRLEWTDPFHYILHPQTGAPGASKPAASKGNVTRPMTRYLYGQTCRWQSLLESFGFGQAGAPMRCGHCDRCTPKAT
ncbi:MAG TPA: ATP-dependent DNA helicase RecQ [Chroococcidiopsis sp.]